MISIAEISWVAGLLEGEGHFSKSGSIKLGMTDFDIVERFHRITKCPTAIHRHWRGENKPCYVIALPVKLSIQWAMTIYSWMGNRRRYQIRDMIEAWKKRFIGNRQLKYSKTTLVEHVYIVKDKKTVVPKFIRKRVQRSFNVKDIDFSDI